MYQELGQYSFDNSYFDWDIRPEDRIISLRNRDILMGGKEGELEFPSWREVENFYGSEGTEERPRYLFSIINKDSNNKEEGRERYFLSENLEIPGYSYKSQASLRKAGPKHKAYAGLYGGVLGGWYKAHSYCGRCGKPMAHDKKERMMRCPECGLMEYPKICPCVIVGVISRGRILVSQYTHGSRDHYALIAGFAETGESIEDCVHREVYEETGLKVKDLKFYKSQPWAFSESLLMGFYCSLDGPEDIVLQEDELSMARFAGPEELVHPWDDFSLTNEMLCKFRQDMERYGQLNPDAAFDPKENSI